MEDELSNPSNGGRTDPSENQCCTSELSNPNNGGITHPPETQPSLEEIDSTCSTPFVSAPSSPGRGAPNNGYYFSAPTSPMHVLFSSPSSSSLPTTHSSELEMMVSASSSEFEFSARFSEIGSNSGSTQMISADELFLNGQIRPMKLSSHLQKPQMLAPLIDLDLDLEEEEEEEENPEMQNQNLVNRRETRLRNRSLRRRTRSLSPLRTSILDTDLFRRETNEPELDQKEETPATTPSVSASSSGRRSSNRWISLKEFLLYRSKSEGREKDKFWSSLTFSSSPSKKPAPEKQQKETGKKVNVAGKVGNAAGKRRVPQSPHEIHYTANRAQAEEMRKKTFLPYRQGLFGCLGFGSKSYTVMNGFARTLHPVSSR